MAHFAEIDATNTVTQIIVVHNNELLDNGIESEAKGVAFCQSLFGGNWIQTSYNGKIRKNYAGIGFQYDVVLDAFIPPKCHDEAVLDQTIAQWNCENEAHNVTVS